MYAPDYFNSVYEKNQEDITPVRKSIFKGESCNFISVIEYKMQSDYNISNKKRKSVFCSFIFFMLKLNIINNIGD